MSLVLCSGDIVCIRGERWRVEPRGRAEPSLLDVRGCDVANADVAATFIMQAERVERVTAAATISVVRPPRWRALAARVLTDAACEPATLVTPARGRMSLLPFQLEPALALLQGRGVRVLIADEVGLGKTVQAAVVIAELLARRADAHVLVLTPAGLRHQWQEELLGRLDVTGVIVDSPALGAPRHAAASPWWTSPVVISSIDFVKRPEVIRAMESIVWDLVVLDEAHLLAGRSDRAAAAQEVARRARQVVLLTATPHDGDPDAFARLTTIGDLDGRFPLIAFRRTRADAGFASRRRTRWIRVRPTSAEALMHDALARYTHRVWHGLGARDATARLAMTLLRRRASSSATALARSVDRRLALLGSEPAAGSQLALPFGGSDDHAEDDHVLSAPGLADMADEHLALTRLLRLATAAAIHGESKVHALERLLRRAKQPALVFTEYRDTLTMLAVRLQGGTAICLHGGLSAAERQLAVRAFTSGTAPLLLATDAASEGLNLHHRSRLVINLELPWTPLRLEQRIGRVERIGQTRAVHEIRLVARETSEELIVSRLVERQQRSATALRALRRPPVDEQAIASAVMNAGLNKGTGEDAYPGLPEEPDAPHPGIELVDLRNDAIEQARHLERLRRLRALATPARSSAAAIASRSADRRGDRALLVYSLSVGDSGGATLAMSLVALEVRMRALNIRTPKDVRDTVRRLQDSLDRELAAMEEVALTRLQTTIEASNAAADLRERAIAASLTTGRASMAERLLQPGLFDRRAERAGAARDAVAAAVHARCHMRLAEHARLRHLRITGRSLVLALLRG